MASSTTVNPHTQDRQSSDWQNCDQLRYTPLKLSDDIRLLRIEPGPKIDTAFAVEPIFCTILHVPLSAKPVYEALSYVWGSTEKTHSIRRSDGSMLRITANLHAALNQLRLTGKSRTLWVDAVCINQADDEERTQQVRMMTRIYSEASNVLIWLGEEEKGDEIAFNFINKLSSEKRNWEKEFGTPWAP